MHMRSCLYAQTRMNIDVSVTLTRAVWLGVHMHDADTEIDWKAYMDEVEGVVNGT